MKKIISVLLTISSIAAFSADKTVLTCTTPGDALSALEFVQTDNGNEIRLHQMNDTTEVYKTDRSFKYIAKEDSDTFVGTRDDSFAFGGAISEAILVRVFKGAKSARMGALGSVYYLTCN